MAKLDDRVNLRPAGAGTACPETGLPTPQPPARRRIPLPDLPGLIRRHWLFSLALLAGVVPRIVAMLGYDPAILFRMDSYDYLWGAVHVSPDLVNPSGYSLFLWLLRPLHSLVLIVALQHLMGLGIGVMVYAVLRRYGLPAWGATLGAAPALFDPAQMLAETLIMADLLAMVLMVAALAALLTRDKPSLARSAAAGLLMGISVTVRPTTLPLVIAIPAFLLLRKVGWRRAGVALMAGALPVLAYMGWFAAAHDSFNMTQSNGLFLWSRTMSFADCQVINPPADLRQLCPTSQHGYLAEPDPAKRPRPKWYLWSHDSWVWQGITIRGIVPDKAPFTQANNDRALRFAVTAITAQPLAYARTVGQESLKPFTTNDRSLHFPGSQPPSTWALDLSHRGYALDSVEGYTGNTQGLAPWVNAGYHYAVRLHKQFVYLMRAYQSLIFLPGPLLALITAAGLAGIIVPRRRTAAAILLWVSAIVIIVLPVAEHEYTYRYALPAVPLLCLAAALAFRKPGKDTPLASQAQAAGQGELAGQAGAGSQPATG